MFGVVPIIKRSGLRAVGAALLLTAVFVPVSLAGNQVPFKGSFTEQFAAVTCPPPGGLLCANATGTGNATHLGAASESFFGVVASTSPAPGCFDDSAKGTITAANGDQLLVTSVGTFCQTSPSTGTDTGTFTFHGGTGRFAGASGGGTYTSNVNLATETSSETYDGTISSVGSAK